MSILHIRKKPVEVTAILWTGTQASTRQVLEFMGQIVDTRHSVSQDKFHDYCDIVRNQGIEISTLEGPIFASVGDYIIRGTRNELYPCKPNVFADCYDVIGDLT